MDLQLGALRDALAAANVPPELAAKAAEELAGHDREFGTPRADIAAAHNEARADTNVLRGELRAEVARLDGRLNLLTWMVGFNLVLTVGVLTRLLTMHG